MSDRPEDAPRIAYEVRDPFAAPDAAPFLVAITFPRAEPEAGG